MGIAGRTEIDIAGLGRAACGHRVRVDLASAAPKHPGLRMHGLLLFPLALPRLRLIQHGDGAHAYLAGVEACRRAMLGRLLCRPPYRYVGRRDHPCTAAGHPLQGQRVLSAWESLRSSGELWIGFLKLQFPPPPSPTAYLSRSTWFAHLPFSAWLLVQLETPRWRQLMALSLAFNIGGADDERHTFGAGGLVSGKPRAPLCTMALPERTGGVWLDQGFRLSCLLVLVVGVLSLGAVPTQNPALLAEGFGATPLERSVLRAGSTRASHPSSGRSLFNPAPACWRSTARLMMANPWTGVVLPARGKCTSPCTRAGTTRWSTDVHAHNEFLQLLGEYGLPVGGGTLAVLLADLLLSTQRTWQLSVTTAERRAAGRRSGGGLV